MSTTKKIGTPCEVTTTRNLKFTQFPEIGKTICVLDGDENAFVNLATRLVDENCSYMSFSPPLFTNAGYVFMKDSYTGVAKVNTEDGDTYSSEVGKQVAKEKAVDKFHKDLSKRIVDFHNDVIRLAAALEHYMDKHDVDYSFTPTISDIKTTKYRDAYMLD